MYNQYEDLGIFNTLFDKRQVPSQYEYMLMRLCRYICAATNTGAIVFLDIDSLAVVREWQAYSSKVSDMDARTDYLVTCGWSARPYGGAAFESFAKVFDLKKLEQRQPIPFHGGAAFVAVNPKLGSTIVLMSTHGQVQVVDVAHPNTSALHSPFLGSHMSHLVLAPSGKAWALADNGGVIQIWALDRVNLRYTEHAAPLEFADEDFAPPSISFDSDL